jgi:3-isopropylmalate dehydrogenase
VDQPARSRLASRKEGVMPLRNIQVDEQAGWLEVTISRPAALNALNAETLQELDAVVEQLRANGELRGLILTGAGEKAFVAGADIAELADLTAPQAIDYARRGQGIFDAIENCGKPVIAAVNGYALGGGCELALACHIRILASTARIGLPEVGLGVIPGYGGTQRLARIVGVGRALEIILTGDPIPADEAFRIGLANRVCDPVDLMDTCRQVAGRINLRGPRAVSFALAAILQGRNLGLPEALAMEADQFGQVAATEDWKEGTRAFLEKRKPVFQGRRERAKMKGAAGEIEKTRSKTYRLGGLPADGIGPEVIEEALRVLHTAASGGGFEISLRRFPYGGDHFQATGELLPAQALDEMRSLDAILLGAIGDPRFEVGLLERAIVAGLRFGLDLYINLRPIRLYDARLCPLKGKTEEQIDLVVVRENTEDLYTGIGGFFKKGTPDEVALQEMILTRKGADRLFRFAFDLARQRGKGRKLTLVDKGNAVAAFDLWTRAFAEMAREYPDVATDHAYIDAACMWLVKNPEWFDTVVTSNVFGDILTDLGAILQGGMGLAASGNLHPGNVSMFEPIHGSAPKYAGRGVANPLAAILAVHMMLDYLGESEAARRVEEAVRGALLQGEIPSASAENGLSTGRMGEIIARRVAAGK